MTADGGARIRNTIDTMDDDTPTLRIEKLIVSNSVSGPFLQRISALTQRISFITFKDSVFQVPPGNTLNEIEIVGANALRSVVVGTNRHLTRLYLENCQVDRIPPTLPSMIELEELVIIKCALTVLRLDMLVNNPKLTIIDLRGNKIRQLFPVSTPPKEMLAIKSFNLGGNQLERLDMALFSYMPDLEWFDVDRNRIVHFEASAPVTYGSLKQLMVTSNKITQFDTRNLTLPVLYSLYLNDNALTEIPTIWGSLPKLDYLGFGKNDIKRLDMSLFARFQTLTGISITGCNVESVRTSTPITMPLLDTLLLENNKIVSVNFTGASFPSMNLISLSDNRLTTIPPLFQRFPTTRLFVDGNPIKCASMSALKSRILNGSLYVSTGYTASDCLTTSSIAIDQNTRGCCDA